MISVIMGIHKIDEYTHFAINSILNQTLTDFEFIIIANGQDSKEIEEYLKDNFYDSRIRILTTSIGQLAHALNLGIDASEYDYIARMDSDDIADLDRLKKQLEFLSENNLDLVGSFINLIDEQNNFIKLRKYPQSHKAINRLLPFKSTFCHPTTMCKKEILLEARGYNSGFNSEDYDLWLRMKRLNVKWGNMSETLLSYRIHSAASQRRILGYAESTGYSVREFFLQKTINNFLAIFVHITKTLFRPDRTKKD